MLFFFYDTAHADLYTLSLHDALPISRTHPAAASSHGELGRHRRIAAVARVRRRRRAAAADRKSTRLNSSHQIISYAVFCLKKKNTYRPLSHALPQHHPKTIPRQKAPT